MKKSLLFVFMFLFLVSFSSATCTISLNKDSYVDGESPVVTMVCSHPNEESQSYTLNWTNATGHQIHVDVGTTSEDKNVHFAESYTLNDSYSAIYGSSLNITLTGTNLEGYDDAGVFVAGISDLIINSFSVTLEYYMGKRGAIKFLVKDSDHNPISNAQCVVDVVNGNNLPIINAEEAIPTQGDGYILFSYFLDETFYTKHSYKWNIACTCHNTTGFTSGLPGYCFNSETGSQVVNFKNGEAQYPFTILDVADKMIINRSVNISSETGVWLENENGFRVNMTESLATVWQEDINWGGYAQVDGQSFLTAGENFRVCMYANNTFDRERHIKLSRLRLIREVGSQVNPLLIDGWMYQDEKILNANIQEGNYRKCSDWLKIPPNIKGQNNWKIEFYINVEDYEQEFIVTSDRFTIFAERTDKDYIDFLTINDVDFTKDNATEGEYIQLKLNFTNNHPFNEIEINSRATFLSNWDLATASARIIDAVPYDIDYVNPDTTWFEVGVLLPANFTTTSLSPRFLIPYGLKDQDVYDIIVGIFKIYFGDDFQYVVRHPIILSPTIDIISKNLEFTNITTTISNTEVSACSVYTISATYDNIVSDTNAAGTEDERFILKSCVEDTINDIYQHCNVFEIQPDTGSNLSGSFTTTVPYVTANTEAEIDLWLYSYEESNIDPKCLHCGELIDFFSGDDGDGTFNISANYAESCRYSKELISSKDDLIYLNWRNVVALEGINESSWVSANSLVEINSSLIDVASFLSGINASMDGSMNYLGGINKSLTESSLYLYDINGSLVASNTHYSSMSNSLISIENFIGSLDSNMSRAADNLYSLVSINESIFLIKDYQEGINYSLDGIEESSDESAHQLSLIHQKLDEIKDTLIDMKTRFNNVLSDISDSFSSLDFSKIFIFFIVIVFVAIAMLFFANKK